MFRDDAQISAAVRVLLTSLRMEHLWTSEGPSDRALEMLEQSGGPMSRGEQLVLRVCFDFWSGRGKANLGDLLNVLDGTRIRLVASLMIAVVDGATAVD